MLFLFINGKTATFIGAIFGDNFNTVLDSPFTSSCVKASANIVNKLAKQVLEIISPNADPPTINKEKIIDSESYA